MPLRLVIGPANSAKAGEVLGAFAAAAPRGALLIVPTSADARHYEEELAGSGVVFATVLTFAGLMREAGLRAGYGARRLTARQRDALLGRALAGAGAPVDQAAPGGTGAPVGSGAPIGAPPGLRHAAGELIAQLTRNLVTAQRFGGALRAWAGQDASRRARARWLGAVYRRYTAELERTGWVDRERYAWGALDALRADPQRWGRDAVFFYGFDDLTTLERDAIETLARICGAPVTVSLTYEAGRQALAARAAAVEELRPLADELAELPARDDHYAPGPRAALHALERGLFDPDAPAGDPGEAVVLLEAGGARAEAELIAGRVRELVRGGTAPEQIAIVRRSVSAAAPLLIGVLAEYGIAAASGREIRFAHTPLGHSVRAAARCALAQRDEASTADLLHYLRAPGRLSEPERADRLELELVQRGERGLDAARRRWGEALPELDAVARATEPGTALLALARQLQAAPRRGAGVLLPSDEALDAAALAALADAVDELTAVGLAPTGSDLLALLDELTLPAASPRRGCVVIAEPLEIRARRFRVVCVGGLQEGAFPLAARVEPLLSERDRRELAAASGLRLPQPEDALARERYLLYAAVSRATEQVLLSYCSSDEEGNLALPSPFVTDLRELLGEAWFERRQRRLLADVVWPAAQAPTERERLRAEAAARAPAAGEPPEAERRLGAIALSRLRHTEVVSAGALEAYGDCPVRWLVERELAPERLEPEPEPMTRGNLMHAVLEALLAELSGPLDASTLPEALAGLDRHLQAFAGAEGRSLGAGRPAVVRAGLLRNIRADLLRYLRHEADRGAGWPRHGVELRFGFADAPGQSLPALELAGGVKVRGMIDRVDTDGAGHALVTDYKSGATRQEHPAARWAADRRLQVALYLLVVRELTPLEPVAGFYQPLRGDDLRGRGMYVDGTELGSSAHGRDGRSAVEFAAELDGAGERAAELVAALRAGRVTPCPQNCSRDGCAHPGICRSQ